MIDYLTENDVKRYQAIYKSQFNVDLDDKVAYEKLTLLVVQMKAIYKPITKAQANEYVIEYEENDGKVGSGSV